MIDATWLKAHRTTSSLRVDRGSEAGTWLQCSRLRPGMGWLICRMKSGMNTRLHAGADMQGRHISLFITAGQVSDYNGAAVQIAQLS